MGCTSACTPNAPRQVTISSVDLAAGALDVPALREDLGREYRVLCALQHVHELGVAQMAVAVAVEEADDVRGLLLRDCVVGLWRGGVGR
jgi:hypothetical protein